MLKCTVSVPHTPFCKNILFWQYSRILPISHAFQLCFIKLLWCTSAFLPRTGMKTLSVQLLCNTEKLWNSFSFGYDVRVAVFWQDDRTWNIVMPYQGHDCLWGVPFQMPPKPGACNCSVLWSKQKRRKFLVKWAPCQWNGDCNSGHGRIIKRNMNRFALLPYHFNLISKDSLPLIG